MIADFGLKIKPQESFFVLFSDETSDERTNDNLNQMMQELRIIANNYGYDVSSWGSKAQAIKFFGKQFNDRS